MEGDTQKRYNSVLEIIDKRLIPDEEAKKARGEVFTPLNLVREMLFGLRKSALDKKESEVWGIDKDGNFFDDDENDRIGGIPLDVWRDPKTTLLDPANGIGNFPVVAFYMLDYQIGNHGPSEYRGDKNKDKRRKHIIKNMLFMIELNKGNVNTARKIFKQIVPGVEANIICADSIKLTEEKMKDNFGINNFDIIMGNPPFNPGPLWEKFINKYIDKTRILIFIVPSTFTSNQTGKKTVELLLKHKLKILTYLEESDFGGINLDMLYFYTDNKYTDKKILINNHTYISYNEPIINYRNKIEISIFKKLLNKKHLLLFRGKNNTLPYKSPKETDNIKFKRNNNHTVKMLSRLGGGDLEYYWIREGEKEEVDTPKIVFPRGTASWNSYNNLINIEKDIVYTTYVDKNMILSDGIMYVPMESINDFESYKFYLMRSKVVRLIFLRINHLSELTKYLFDFIPEIPVKYMTSDENIYKYLDFSDEEKKYIDEYFKDIKLISKKNPAKTEKATKPKKGGAKSHRYTRRKSRV
jgi:hypothetical protein